MKSITYVTRILLLWSFSCIDWTQWIINIIPYTLLIDNSFSPKHMELIQIINFVLWIVFWNMSMQLFSQLRLEIEVLLNSDYKFICWFCFIFAGKCFSFLFYCNLSMLNVCILWFHTVSTITLINFFMGLNIVNIWK